MAIENFEASFKIRAELFGEDSKEADGVRFFMGLALYYAKMYEKAKECFSASLILREKLYGKNSHEYYKAKEWLDKL